MIYTIEEIKQKITPIAVKYKIPTVYIFGSYARNEATENSDIDILVNLDGSTVKGWEIGNFYSDIEDTFEKKVDILTNFTLMKEAKTHWEQVFRDTVKRERVALYG